MKKLLLICSFALFSAVGIFARLPERATLTMKSLRSQPTVRGARAAELAETNTVPYVCTLGKNNVDGYTVADANDDGRTWKPGGFTAYSVCMSPNSETIDAADDWMFSPAIGLEAGKSYNVSFDTDMSLNKTEDIIELMAGTEATVEAMTERVSPEIKIHYNNKVFTTNTFTFTPKGSGNYFFGFHCKSLRSDSGTPKLANFKVEEASTPVVVPDNAQEIPFIGELGKNDPKIGLYTVIDANNDGRTWNVKALSTGSVCMKPNSDAVAAADDWMISMPLHLFAGKDYMVSIDEGWALNSGVAERAALYLGSEPTVEAMTKELIAPHDVTEKGLLTNSAKFSVVADGYYYIGIHCTSEKEKSGNYKVANLSVKEFTETVEPAAAGTLSYVIAPKGELKATLTYTAPTLTKSGKPLESISKVVITTNWAYPTELNDVVPGGTYTVDVDNLWQGKQNRFEAVAYVGEIAGEPILIKDVFAGEDTPLTPENLKISLSDDYKKVTLTWDAVGEIGENGGWVDTENVSYYIFDAFGAYTDPAIAFTTDTSYSLDFSDFKGQDFVAYQVTACVGEYNASLAATSDIVVIGEPDKLPFHESFSDCYYQQAWVIDPESSGQVMDGLFYDNELQTNTDAEEGTEPTFLNSQDADNGFYLAIPYDKNASRGFYSTKIDISGVANPVFQLFYQGKGSILEMKVGKDGAPMEVVKSINLKDNPTDDWTIASVDLTPYKDARYIQIGLMIRGVHNTDTETWSVPIDNIRVINQVAKDVRIAAVANPEKVQAGETVTVSVRLENIGTEELKNVTVCLPESEEKTIMIDEIPVFSTTNVVFSIATGALSPDKVEYMITAAAEGDADTGNNSVASSFGVEFPLYPMPTGLTATTGDALLSLTWNAPEYESLRKTHVVEEDFENADYPVFTISDFGGWTMVDNDGNVTYTFMGDVNNPYRTKPQAYQLFDTKASGMKEESYIDAEPFSGERMLVAWSAKGQNDNWLISPLLSSKEQTISFRAKSFTIAYPESFEVLYSKTDKELESFVRIENVENYPENNQVLEDWIEYKAVLPEGARYFAIRHTAYDTYALFIDDICFEAAGLVPSDLELLGYCAYIDGEAVSELCKATAVDIPFAESGRHSARVSAVYNYGESRACGAVEADVIVSGVENVSAGVCIAFNGTMFTVSGAQGTPVTVFSASGRCIFTGVIGTSGVLDGELPVGVCVVKAGDTTAKHIAF